MIRRVPKAKTALFLSLLVAAGGCGAPANDSDAAELISTSIDRASCTEQIDFSDPNETPYLECPGVSGYSLMVKQVGSGRTSISVLTPDKQEFPLDFDRVISTAMADLESTAQWQVTTSGGSEDPIALIASVRVREDLDEPDNVTATYAAVAKITPDQICVTDRIEKLASSEQAIATAAAEAIRKSCLPPLPDTPEM